MADQQVILFDVLAGPLGGLHRNLARIVQVLLRQAANAGGHRRREQGNLLLTGGILQDALDILLEAHVQHLICLVEHHEAQLGNIQAALLQVVDHAAGRTDHNVRTPAQAGQLYAVGLAAVDRQHVDAAQVLGEGLEALGNLQRKLARRCQYEGLGVTLRHVNTRQNRQRKCGRLTGTGLCEADHVVAFHEHRNGFCLDRGRYFEADLLDCS